jgi:hypothetical protein
MAKGFAETGIGEGVLTILGAIASIALISMLVARADQTSKLIRTAATGYESILRAATFQGGGTSTTLWQ